MLPAQPPTHCNYGLDLQCIQLTSSFDHVPEMYNMNVGYLRNLEHKAEQHAGQVNKLIRLTTLDEYLAACYPFGIRLLSSRLERLHH